MALVNGVKGQGNLTCITGGNTGNLLFFQKNGRQQTPLCDLYVTLLQQMGVERDKFGSNKGNLNQLLV